MKVNTLRQYWKNADEFDNYLRERLQLKVGSNTREDHAIWQVFEPKFGLSFELYYYHEFFSRILYRVTRDFMNEMVTVVEFRHSFGQVFDDNRNLLTLEQELALF